MATTAWRQYEPELFPGLIYRMLDPKCTLLVFVSGKIIVTGCKVRGERIGWMEVLWANRCICPMLFEMQDPSENQEALGKIYPVLLQFRLRVDSSSDSSSNESEDEQGTPLEASQHIAFGDGRQCIYPNFTAHEP